MKRPRWVARRCRGNRRGRERRCRCCHGNKSTRLGRRRRRRARSVSRSGRRATTLPGSPPTPPPSGSLVGSCGAPDWALLRCPRLQRGAQRRRPLSSAPRASKPPVPATAARTGGGRAPSRGWDPLTLRGGQFPRWTERGLDSGHVSSGHGTPLAPAEPYASRCRAAYGTTAATTAPAHSTAENFSRFFLLLVLAKVVGQQ